MLKDCSTSENLYQAPHGNFVYLGASRIIKCYPNLKQTYIVVRKDGVENHVLGFDHESDQMIFREEVLGILDRFYPIYPTLMSEVNVVDKPDFEKVALGIAMAMNTYHQYQYAMIYFRHLHTNACIKKENFKGKRPFGDPSTPKDKFKLGYIYRAYPRNGAEMFTFDGYTFPEEVMEILLNDYQIIEPCKEPRIYKKLLTDAWRLKRRS